ncbi:MAG: hypothetical protein EPN92_03370 [Chitinophagaceae bacterium]|nr:MAG: hypothetical protein EPN92_03370 [Chitinophagaceae bacterium]
MIRVFLSIAFGFSVTLSFGQKEKENNFYTFLQNQIKEAVIKKDSVIVIEETKACFGSTWKAVVKPESNYTTVTFYVDKAIGVINDTSTNIFQTIVDTSFSLQTKTLLDNLDSEIKYLRSNLVISYTTTEYLIRQGDTQRKFKLQKGQGLYYWLRFNKSWANYLAGQ